MSEPDQSAYEAYLEGFRGPWAHDQIRAIAEELQEDTNYSGYQMIGVMIVQLLDEIAVLRSRSPQENET